ncbi:lipopolysaccharide transport system permease protein [Paenibacillus endophyticus]|uniref:Transport permease protein n=1 Tax=Paenibacillus endophyticus TaxID=1294268 RepID=A0A7W5C471_9BACL|nr:ABC transporter permease [Paenibacillus endophyticus]MBB3150886.1 lipopolysaccharide transport system permease protein [Paenibacillus endophyticus]
MVNTKKFMLRHLWNQKSLINQFIKREVIGRYRGSYLGIVWSFINPLMMLLIYTYFFSVVFKAKWGGGAGESQVEFALILFCGLITFNLFSDVITRSPSIVINNPNYVKKVVFPLEIFPITILGSALVHFLISLFILTSGLILLMGIFNWTIIFVPIVLLPLLFMSLGLSWFFASLGVFIRDIGQFLGIAVQALMFLSPIFYPISIIPEKFRFFYYINPISYVVEDMRKVIILGQLPDWSWLFIGTIIGVLLSWLGYAWFQKTKGGFADVL